MNFFPKFDISPVIMCITYKKVFVIKLKFEFLLDSKPSDILVQILRNFPRDVQVFKQRTCLGVQNILFFFTTSSYDIMST
jgi:hypothetical protein